MADGEKFTDRELSWLSFNQRVLELAEDPSHTNFGESPISGDIRFKSR
ncbi:MAG: hypothetical protein WDO06_01430 [Actinomycetota bacterium]